MISIIEQNRREAVKQCQQDMAMTFADVMEEEYERGWSAALDHMPSVATKFIRSIVLFLAGAASGALLIWLLP